VLDLLLKIHHPTRRIERVDLESETLIIHGQKGYSLEVTHTAEHAAAHLEHVGHRGGSGKVVLEAAA